MGQVNIRHKVVDKTVNGTNVKAGELFNTKYLVKGNKDDTINIRRTGEKSTRGFRVQFDVSPNGSDQTSWLSVDDGKSHTVTIKGAVNGEYEYKIYYEHEDEVGKVLPLDPVIIIGRIGNLSFQSLVIPLVVGFITLALGYFAGRFM